MPFVLLIALVISDILQAYGFLETLPRLVFLSASFPVGFSLGRLIYVRRSHVEILFDDAMFRVFKGTKETKSDLWKNYKFVSIALDQYGRPDLRLYKTLDGDYVNLPISRTNAEPQGFRDYVQRHLSSRNPERVNPRVVEAV